MDTAHKINVSRRTIELDLEIAKELDADVKLKIRELDIPKEDAIKLIKMTPEMRQYVIQKIEEKKEKG